MKHTIAVVTCYHQPNYVRAQTLRAALRAQPDVHVLEIKNSRKGLLRYPEVAWKVWRCKRQYKLDALLLTFRGQEMLPIMLLLAGRTRLWFDEFIVPAAYARFEHHTPSASMLVKHVLSRVGEPLYAFCLKRCAYVLADTTAHAELGAKMSHINMSRYLALPVGTDEKVFHPEKSVEKAHPFQIFYYSSGMQPLHGIPTVLEAAVMLQHDPVQFVLVGGKTPMQKAVRKAQSQGANIRYERWLSVAELAQTMHESQLNLGGPFGGTKQALHVVTGKTYQSLACQVATVVGAGMATDEYFVDKQNCLRVVQKDSAALAETIRWAVSHADQLTVLAKAGRILYEREFSSTALAAKIRPLVETLDR